MLLDGRRRPDPCSRHQPKGLRGPSRIVDTGRLRVERRAADGRARGPRRLRDARRLLHRRGDLRRRPRAPAGAARARRHRDRGDAGRRLPRAARLGLRRRLRLRAVRSLRRAGRARPLRRRRPRGGPRGDPRLRLQPPRRLRQQSDDRLRPLLRRRPPDRLGEGAELRRRAVRSGPRMGDPERRDVGPRLPDRRPAARRRARDPRPEPHPSGGRADRTGACHPRGCGGDRREQRQRSGDDPARLRGRLGSRRAVGRRLPPLAAHAADRGAPGVLRRLRHRRRPGQGLPPALRLRRAVLAGARAHGRRARRGPRAGPVRRLLAEPRPGRQPRARRPDAARGAPARRALHAARAVHADALHGRGVRRGSALPVLHRPHREEDRRSDPQRAPQGVRRLRRVRRRSARPAGRRDLRALEADPGRQPGDRIALRAALRAARGSWRRGRGRPRSRRSTSTRTPAGCA